MWHGSGEVKLHGKVKERVKESKMREGERERERGGGVPSKEPTA